MMIGDENSFLIFFSAATRWIVSVVPKPLAAA
jgi:hypothetical protein